MADLARLAVGFGEALREAGVPATLEQSGRFVRSVQLINPLSINDLYWAARITLVSQHDDLEVFDRVFAQVFRGVVDPADYRGASPQTAAPARDRRAAASGTSTREAGSDDHQGRDLSIAAASHEERLATTDFAELDEAELAELRRLMLRLRLSPPLRQGRRARRHPHGHRLDLRATIRRARHSAGDPVRQIRRRRRPRPRRLVVLCDISGSMTPYARAYVQFLHASAGGARAEVFTFATRLTRLTPALAGTQPQLALQRAAEAAPDWHSGTRIGAAVKAFLDDYGRRGAARGAVVVIVSDGWERDDPGLLGEQMARLNRLAHRIIWVNPRSADGRYQPLAGGMAAALPHCDALVSGHTFAALGQLVELISVSQRRR